MKLLIVERGDYSDFVYIPLVVSNLFDLEAMKAAYVTYVLALPEWGDHDFPDNEYVDGVEESGALSAWLVRQYQARDLDVGETVTYLGIVEDPIHYGCWQPTSTDWPHDIGRSWQARRARNEAAKKKLN